MNLILVIYMKNFLRHCKVFAHFFILPLAQSRICVRLELKAKRQNEQKLYYAHFLKTLY